MLANNAVTATAVLIDMALLPTLGGQAVVQAFTLKAFSLGAADISIGLCSSAKSTIMRCGVDAKDTTKLLAVEKNYVAT
jgi:hypothetical protein